MYETRDDLLADSVDNFRNIGYHVALAEDFDRVDLVSVLLLGLIHFAEATLADHTQKSEVIRRQLLGQNPCKSLLHLRLALANLVLVQLRGSLRISVISFLSGLIKH